MAARMTVSEDLRAFELASRGWSNRQIARELERDGKSIEAAIERHRERLRVGELKMPAPVLSESQREGLEAFFAWMEEGRKRGWISILVGVAHGKAPPDTE